MSRLLVLGDIHGAYRALEQCLERSSFDPTTDQLMVLGDVCDGWPEVHLCIQRLLEIPSLIYILGNHDSWALQWMQTGEASEIWLDQGGQATVNCYAEGVPAAHQEFLEKASLYHLHQESLLFVHAGILPEVSLEDQDESIFLWDRSLFNLATRMKFHGQEEQVGPFKEIYIGHSPTVRVGYHTPIQSGNIWMMDTGAAWDGCLTIMDVHSKEFFQSDIVQELYPGIKGR